MNQSEYSKIITIAKRTIEEHKNWDEEEITTDKENKEFSRQEMKKTTNIPKQNKNAGELLEDLQKKVCKCKKC
ncbi:MAG: hypothetical protein PHH62_06935, partial [Endomicrobiaceae bacterium]|nr:hypothetical protein [Endomicrobiaceae bacterium]